MRAYDVTPLTSEEKLILSDNRTRLESLIPSLATQPHPGAFLLMLSRLCRTEAVRVNQPKNMVTADATLRGLVEDVDCAMHDAESGGYVIPWLR